MKKGMTKRLTASLLTLCMLMSLLPTTIFAEDSGISLLADTPLSEQHNHNQGDGIVLTKKSEAKADGTVDITIEAFTTGEVTSHTTTTPTDIVLVLDVSGSMDDSIDVPVQGYHNVYATEYTTGFWFWQTTDYIGVPDGGYYYINTGTEADPVYTPVTYADEDSGYYHYYYYYSDNGTTVYVYPQAENGTTFDSDREFTYDVVEFYQYYSEGSTVSMDKIDVLKQSVTEFINGTAAQNASISDPDEQHRISIVKFADDSFHPDGMSTVGNNFTGSYNYTQIVAGLTTVSGTNVDTLINSVDALSAGGATAVDFGLELAQHVLYSVPQAELTARNQVVIVVADGEPNHQSGYDSQVAATAINNALALKNAGSTVYSISLISGADSTQLGDQTNAFMHYISGNYPAATAATESPYTITAGDGSPTAGYYMAPADGDLDHIFEAISHQIGTPTMEVGSEATIFDTISNFFNVTDLPGGTKNAVAYTADADPNDADGWKNRVAATGVTVNAGDKEIAITGFDFDANYVSATPRTVNGSNFYGRKLVVVINVEPYYLAIDTAADMGVDDIRNFIYDSQGNAYLNTNDASAYVADSNSEIIAEVASPAIPINKVTYTVDGATYDTLYRLAGTTGDSMNVLAEPTKTGHDFSGWSSTDVNIAPGTFTMPAEDVEITGSFTANKYKVTYRIDGVIPDDAVDSVPTEQEIEYGTEVTISDKLSAANYNFVGWYVDDIEGLSGQIVSSPTKFTMPAHNVVFYGRFDRIDGVEWKEEHYLQNIDGTYSLDNTATGNITHSNMAGVDVKVYAGDYTGYSFNTKKTNGENGGLTVNTTDNSITATVPSVSDELVVKFYYDRIEYEVSYQYNLTISGATPLPEKATAKYGDTVEVAADATAPGYTFQGWETTDATIVGGNPDTFTMPDHNVVITGTFVARRDIPYTIKHHYEKLPTTIGPVTTTFDEANYESNVNAPDATKQGATSAIGEVTSDDLKVLEGFYVRTDYSTLSGTITVDPDTGEGTLVLDVYYDRIRNDVTYAYFGAKPAGTENWPNPETVTDVPYGYEFKVAILPTLGSRTFNGWYSAQVPTLMMSGNTDDDKADTFTMPAEDVTLLGEFNPQKLVTFKVLNGTWADGTTADITVEVELSGADSEGTLLASSVPTGMLASKGYEQTTGAWDVTPPTTVVGTAPVTYTYIFDPNVTYPEYDPEDPTPEPKTDPEEYDKFILVDPNGGTWKNPADSKDYTAPVQVQMKAAIDLGNPNKAPDRTDYVFVGWKKTAPSAEQAESNIVAVYTAQWEEDTIGEPDPEKPDDIPDKYQRKIIFKVINGTWADGKTADIVQVVTLGGNANPSVNSTATVAIPTGMVAKTNYGDGEWRTPAPVDDGNSNIVVDKSFAEVTEYTYAFHITPDVMYDKYIEDAPVPEPSVDQYSLDDKILVDPDGGIWTVPEGNETTAEGTTSTVPVVVTLTQNIDLGTPTKTDYVFMGWEVSVPTDEELQIDPEIIKVYTAIWEPDEIGEPNPHDGDDLSDKYQRIIHFKVVNGTWADNTTADIVKVVTLEKDGVADIAGTAMLEVPTGMKPNTNYSGGAWSPAITGASIKVDSSFAAPDADPYYTLYTYTFTDKPGVQTEDPDPDLYETRDKVLVKPNGGTWSKPVGVTEMNTKPEFTGATTTVDTIITLDDTIIVLGTPTKANHTFTGWTKTDPTAAEKQLDNAIVAVYTAQYRSNSTSQPDPSPSTGGVTLTKVDTNDANTRLANVKFELYKKDGTKVGTEYITNANGQITISSLETGSYYWLETRPAAGYTIDHTKHEFTVSGGRTTTITVKNSRTDVPEVFTGDHYAYIIGMPDGLVHPEASITRAEVATIFFRLLDEDTRKQYMTTQNNFPDSNEGDWFNTAVSTLTAMDIITGLPDGTFGPTQEVTRAEFAAVAARFEENGDTSPASFTDIYQHWAYKEINISANNGWVLGHDDGTFKPYEIITRSEAMAMVNRVLQRIPQNENDLLKGMIEWPDNMKTNEWYYLTVQEATNSHDYERKTSGYEYWTALTENPDWTTFEK